MLQTQATNVEAEGLSGHDHAIEAIVEHYRTDAKRGLPASEAKDRLQRQGRNVLAEARSISALRQFLAQFQQLVIWILIGAAVIAGALGEWTDTAVIIAIVIVNGILGFLQERRADRALAALQKLSIPQARVIRDGATHSVASADLVPGDLVELEAGDRVPADLRLIHA